MAAFIFTGLAAAYWMLALLDVNRFKPEIIAAVKTATGRVLTLGGDIELRIGLRPTLAVENVRFENAPWASRKDMLHLERIEIQIAAWPLIFGALDIRRILLVAPELLLETSPDGAWNLPSIRSGKDRKTADPGGASVELLRHLIFAVVRIENGRAVWRDSRSGRTSTLVLDNAGAGMTGEESRLRVKMRGTYEKRGIEISGTLGRFSRLVEGRQPWPLDLLLTSGKFQVGISGTVKCAGASPTVDIACRIQGDSLAEMETFFPRWPLSLEEKFSMAFRFSYPKAGQLRFSDVSLGVGESDLSGWAGVEYGGPRIRLHGDFRSKKMDLKSSMGKDAGGNASGRRTRVFSDRRIDFRFLQEVDSEVHLAIEKLQTPMLSLEHMDLHWKASNGSALLRPVTIQMDGGFAEGQARIRSTEGGGWISLRISARQLPVQKIFTAVSPPILEGKVDIDARLLSRGNSLAEWMAGLDGKIFWVMEKGKIRTRHVDLLGGEITGSLVRHLSIGSEEESCTDLNCLVAEIDLLRGTALCRGLLLDTDRTTIAGEGKIDLFTEAIDLTMDPSPKGGLGFKGLGGLSLSLGALGKPFKLGGTLGAPKIVFDTAGTALTIGKILGGFTLAGPLGLAAAFADFSSGGKNPCLKAIEAHKERNAGAGK
ncbi:MAG: AsmA family protein [Desulfobacterales bacterium]|nr:AsmA family protein [Desulfobacterales bacterium]